MSNPRQLLSKRRSALLLATLMLLLPWSAYSGVNELDSEQEIDHISLSRWSDLIIVLPTTANFMTKLSIGRAEDLATTVLLASNKDILLVRHSLQAYQQSLLIRI